MDSIIKLQLGQIKISISTAVSKSGEDICWACGQIGHKNYLIVEFIEIFYLIG
jgi:hypothetical protein